MAKPIQAPRIFSLLLLSHYLYIFDSEYHGNRQKVPQSSSGSMRSSHIIPYDIHIA